MLTCGNSVHRNIGFRHGRRTDHERVQRLLHQMQGERQHKSHFYVVVQRSDI